MSPQTTQGQAPRPAKDRSRLIRRIAIGILVAAVLLAGGAVTVAYFITSQPTFFNRYTDLKTRAKTMSSGMHKDLGCADCHSDNAFAFRAAVMGDWLVAPMGTQRLPRFVKFAPPTRQTCLKCHFGAWSYNKARTSKVPHPAHLRVSSEKRDCVQPCHKWTSHEEAYMEKHKSMPFSGVCISFGCHVGYKPKDQCTTCHHTVNPDKEAWKKAHPAAVARIGGNACLEKCHNADQCRECHTTGRMPKFTGLEAQSGAKVIEAMHAQSDWLDQHGTQALKDPAKCTVCHISKAECNDCHSNRPAFHGTDPKTWIGTHKNFAKDKRRCYACHKAAWCDECHAQFKEMK